MFKVSAFSVDTSWQTTPPLVDGVVHNRRFSSHLTVRCAHKSGDVINFIIVACRISSRLKWYKNYKNRLRLAKVIVRNKMSRFLWFSVYNCLQLLSDTEEWRCSANGHCTVWYLQVGNWKRAVNEVWLITGMIANARMTYYQMWQMLHAVLNPHLSDAC